MAKKLKTNKTEKAKEEQLHRIINWAYKKVYNVNVENENNFWEWEKQKKRADIITNIAEKELEKSKRMIIKDILNNGENLSL